MKNERPKEDLMLETPTCNKCKHLSRTDFGTCTAFPSGIPKNILLNYNKHTKPLKEQDNKIVFESDEKGG